MQNVLIADNLELICTGMSYLIDQQHTNLHVVGHTHNGTDTFMAIEQDDVDVVIMGLDMPGENGLLTIQRIHDFYPEVGILVLTVHDEKECVAQCFKNGAMAYVLKSSPNTEILNALNHVTDQQAYVDPEIPICEDDFKQLASDCPCGCPEECNSRYALLSRREREVFPLVTLGYANREIAERLCISTKTVEAHKANIMRKLSLSCHVDLVHYAVNHHLVNV